MSICFVTTNKKYDHTVWCILYFHQLNILLCNLENVPKNHCDFDGMTGWNKRKGIFLCMFQPVG